MRFLFIDTCTERGILAYGDSHTLLFEKHLPFGLSQSKFLMPDLAEALQPFGSPPILDAIGVGIGPGSYTGIRLGVAVAQTLAYAWKVPLVGISSLEGFVPVEYPVHFAAILDARIGGVYVQKGWSKAEGVYQRELPQVLPIEEVENNLEGVTHLVTPAAKSLQTKLALQDPHREWIWQERAPSAQVALQRVEQEYAKGNLVFPPQHLDLLYLRQTEAEREAQRKKENKL